jgi:hypothetical protein
MRKPLGVQRTVKEPSQKWITPETGVFPQAYQQVNYPQMLRESLWIFVDLCGYLWIFVDLCGYLWIFVDICGYSIQSYLHAGRPFPPPPSPFPAAGKHKNASL